MPIIVAPINQVLKVVKVLVDDKTKHHLENLGIMQNSEVIVLSHSNGDVIIKVKETRLALNKDIALKILVAWKEKLWKSI